ncbi:uncharacterized protein LOC131064987 isoform X1 [Cryptomeria japonica]|uniref:uncharacterized protein LOC131064987 isoform X1 n=1 Tax=Cryptomeria japonica TaxID=3369 RepID=UPI0027DA7D55|nr:uncharacterized protein LOC131064987 isoform X1 [Cryptomeria japonica]
MASKKRRKNSLADCTNTPRISRPRRACCSYVLPSSTKQNLAVQSPQPNNPLIDNQSQNEGHLKVKSSFATPTTVLAAIGSYRTPQRAEDGGQTTRVYSKCREKEGASLQVTSSCPPLGRGSVKSQHKAGGSSEAKNLLKNFEDSLTPASSTHDQNEISLSGNDICRENLSTPHPFSAATDTFQFSVDNEDANFQNILVQRMLQGLDSRSFEKASLSCPPLGRAVRKRSTVERCTKVRLNSSLGAWDDSPVSGIPKMRAQRRRNSVPIIEGKYSMPENFVQEQSEGTKKAKFCIFMFIKFCGWLSIWNLFKLV